MSINENPQKYIGFGMGYTKSKFKIEKQMLYAFKCVVGYLHILCVMNLTINTVRVN